MKTARTNLSRTHCHVLVLNAPVPRGALGRSGVFTARSVELHSRPAVNDTPGTPVEYGTVDLSVFSAKRGDRAPVSLALSPEDALLLGEALIVAAGEAFGLRTLGELAPGVPRG